MTWAGSERLSSPQAEETDLAPTVEYIKEYFLTGEEPLWKQHDELCDWQPPSAWEESGGLQGRGSERARLFAVLTGVSFDGASENFPP